MSDSMNALEDFCKDARVCSLLFEELDSFVIVYDAAADELMIDPIKNKFISIPWEKANVQQKNYDKLVFRPDIPAVTKFLDLSTLTREEPKRNLQVRLFTDYYNYAWFRLFLMAVFDRQGNRDRFYLLCTNIDEKTRLAQNLKFMSSSDALTHLANLHVFLERAGELIKNNSEKHYQIIRFDVNHFRSINIIFGSTEGDNLLKFIAVRIQEFLEEEEYAAYCRASLDNFVICVPKEAYTAQKIVEYLQWSVSVYPSNFEVTLSFGIYEVTDEDCRGQIPVNVLVDRAASAHNSVKGNYIRHIGYYDKKIKRQDDLEFMVTSEMGSALLKHQFRIFYQPKVEMDTGRLVGAEALVRWQHPVKGLIAPTEFIPIFESNGFILELDDYVIESTCKTIREWLDKKKKALPVSVNLSRANLYNPRLIEQIETYVKRYQIPRELLAFELLESSFVTDNYNLAKLMQKLREKEFQVLMDDFGSGYSSLNALRLLPVDVLKIDRGFLPANRENVDARIILKCVVEMAKGLGLDIVVEGVETKEQAEYLLELGCRIAQGFYYYYPMPKEEYEKHLM